jgi:glycosyltransferase involved in cell wall biosynthesis
MTVLALEPVEERVYEHRPVVVVIPAYNEERFIASVVFGVREFADEVVVVDDGSSDRTALLAERAGASVVRLGENGGKGAALNAGFTYANSLAPSAVVCIDGDAQHEASEIPGLIQPILSGEADVVIGSRFLSTRSRIPGWRLFGQHSLTTVTNTLSGTRVTDSQSGFRAFSPLATQALRFTSSGLSVESSSSLGPLAFGLRKCRSVCDIRTETNATRSYMDFRYSTPC